MKNLFQTPALRAVSLIIGDIGTEKLTDTANIIRTT